MTQRCVFPCRVMPMVIQFSILIMLHSALVLITTAEDYKCLPLVLRKTCCWINETYLARNVIIFASILINFLGAILNIVSTPSPPTPWYLVCSQEPRVYGTCSFLHCLPGYQLPSCASSSPKLRDREGTCGCTVRTVHFTGEKLSFFPARKAICSKGAPNALKFLYCQWSIRFTNRNYHFLRIHLLCAMH